jgi:transcriptional regulator with XRE-family HTH domain
MNERQSTQLHPPAPVVDSPTVLRIGLGAQLRELRERRRLSREAAGEATQASPAKISRIELGRVGFKERDIADLLTLYGITDPVERTQFLALAQRANAPGWWHNYADLLPHWFETFLGLEQASSVIRTYECQFVPGLLQTPDYARASPGSGTTMRARWNAASHCGCAARRCSTRWMPRRCGR